jgi:MEMO1 family protein
VAFAGYRINVWAKAAFATGVAGVESTDIAPRARPPAVAGLFYPDDPYELRAVVRGYLDRAPALAGQPKAIIVPHAGYVYSGAIAATAFRALEAAQGTIKRVVLAGPSHRIPVPGVAVPKVASFDTPLGSVPVDQAALEQLLELPHVYANNLPHRLEHSLEVQLPFLQMTLGEFSMVPLAVGEAPASVMASVFEACWGGPETLIVLSTDLSHYRDYAGAQLVDRATVQAIVDRRDDLQDEQACGCRVLNGFMRVARRRGLTVQALDLSNSGDTSGDLARVVGYGAFAVYGA